MTEYGTHSITTDTQHPQKQKCACTKKFVYCSFTTFAFLFITVYLIYSQFVQNDANPRAQIKTEELTNIPAVGNTMKIENCANDGDVSCDSKYGCCSYQDDIQIVMTNIAQQWTEYSEYIQDKTEEILESDGCLANKFANNRLICQENCDVVGYNIDSDEANICKNTFLNEMKSTLKPYRRSCIASLISRQFATLCGRRKDISASIERATFLWWKDIYSVSSLWIHENCPYYILVSLCFAGYKLMISVFLTYH
eukprot:UN01329